MREVWAVKHRPATIDEFVGQQHLIDEFKAITEGAPMQHYIFYSPEAGTGKTSLAYILAKALGYQIHKYNASSKRQRGIEFIEEELAPMTRLGQYETIFFLDEADQLTPAAQSALKGVIEDSQGFFILTCNDLSKVSTWLQSRCQVRTFVPLTDSEMFVRLHQVDAREGYKTSTEHLDMIIDAHKGDLRNAINALQAYHSIPEDKREAFLISATAPMLPADTILRLCFKEQNVAEAVKQIGSLGDLRKKIDIIFKAGLDSHAQPVSKLKLVRVATQAQRDLLDGVESHYVVWDFCRGLAE
tara:strand:- start:1215 stop:2114 length:900 start_codon:yes stop_codon:yes gene_type:complete